MTNHNYSNYTIRSGPFFFLFTISVQLKQTTTIQLRQYYALYIEANVSNLIAYINADWDKATLMMGTQKMLIAKF